MKTGEHDVQEKPHNSGYLLAAPLRPPVRHRCGLAWDRHCRIPGVSKQNKHTKRNECKMQKLNVGTRCIEIPDNAEVRPDDETGAGPRNSAEHEVDESPKLKAAGGMASSLAQKAMAEQ